MRREYELQIRSTMKVFFLHSAAALVECIIFMVVRCVLGDEVSYVARVVLFIAGATVLLHVLYIQLRFIWFGDLVDSAPVSIGISIVIKAIFIVSLFAFLPSYLLVTWVGGVVYLSGVALVLLVPTDPTVRSTVASLADFILGGTIMAFCFNIVIRLMFESKAMCSLS